jgi:hypothetical protein
LNDKKRWTDVLEKKTVDERKGLLEDEDADEEFGMF